MLNDGSGFSRTLTGPRILNLCLRFSPSGPSRSCSSTSHWRSRRAPTPARDGAVVTFLGLVRNHNLGRSVRYLEYERYEPLALKSVRANRSRNRRAMAERAAGAAPPDRPPRSGRSQRRHRHAVRRIAATPTPPAGTRSNASSRSRRSGSTSSSTAATSGSRGHGEPGRPSGARGSGADRVRVTVRLFARLRDVAGASELARDLAPGATIGDVWRQLARRVPGACRLRAFDLERDQRRLRAHGSGDRRRRRNRVPAAGFGG